MIILLTNDDGVKSEGLESLRKTFEKKHDVWILAPDGERSGTSHRITLKGPLQLKKHAEKVFSCSGSPADCVILGLLGGIPQKPDLVLSGINIGPNLGTDLVYSGTAAAARQSVLMGVPAIALSLDSFEAPFYFDSLSRFADKNLETLLGLWTKNHFANINAPNRESYAGLSITHPSRRIYHDKLVEFKAPDQNTYYFIQGTKVETLSDEGSDWEAVSRGEVSITPVSVHPVPEREDAPYRKAQLALI